MPRIARSQKVYVPNDSHRKPEGRKDRTKKPKKNSSEESGPQNIAVTTTKSTVEYEWNMQCSGNSVNIRETRFETSVISTTILDFPGNGYTICSPHDLSDLAQHGYSLCPHMPFPYLHNRNQTIRGMCGEFMRPCVYPLKKQFDPNSDCAEYAEAHKPAPPKPRRFSL